MRSWRISAGLKLPVRVVGNLSQPPEVAAGEVTVLDHLDPSPRPV
jgi:hypothetical protein